MTTQKTFKRRVRARAAKTGESYTTARSQLLRRAGADEQIDAELLANLPVSDDQVLRNTGRRFGKWVELLDTWGARERRHAEIARWLADEHAVPAWYTQTITVGYERARGMRAVHETARGFTVGVSRTIGADAERVTDAFTDPALRQRWLPDAPMQERTVRLGRSARFDWADPESRLVVTFDAKDDGRTVVSVTQERLPGPQVIDGLKAFWRERLAALKALLEAG